MKKIKNIQFRVKVKGEGIVNFDSNDQKWILQHLGFTHLLVRNPSTNKLVDNVTYGKKRFYINSEGDNDYKPIISADAWRKAIFGQDIPFSSAMLATNDELFISYIGHPATFLRGYMQTMGKNELSFAKKTVVYTSDAIQTNDTKTHVEIFSKSGDRDATSLRYREVAGDMEYAFHGTINLQEMQFVSLSELFSRQSFNPDWFERYCNSMRIYLPNFSAKEGFYLLKNSGFKVPERGFIIDDTTMVQLVKYFFGKLLNASITQSKSFAGVSEVQYKIVENPLNNLVNDEEGWVTLTYGNLNDISFNVERFYVETIDPLEISLESDIIKSSSIKKEIKKEKNKDEAERIKQWKLDKSNNND